MRPESCTCSSCRGQVQATPSAVSSPGRSSRRPRPRRAHRHWEESPEFERRCRGPERATNRCWNDCSGVGKRSNTRVNWDQHSAAQHNHLGRPNSSMGSNKRDTRRDSSSPNMCPGNSSSSNSRTGHNSRSRRQTAGRRPGSGSCRDPSPASHHHQRERVRRHQELKCVLCSRLNRAAAGGQEIGDAQTAGKKRQEYLQCNAANRNQNQHPTVVRA